MKKRKGNKQTHKNITIWDKQQKQSGKQTLFKKMALQACNKNINSLQCSIDETRSTSIAEWLRSRICARSRFHFCREYWEHDAEHYSCRSKMWLPPAYGHITHYRQELTQPEILTMKFVASTIPRASNNTHLQNIHLTQGACNSNYRLMQFVA